VAMRFFPCIPRGWDSKKRACFERSPMYRPLMKNSSPQMRPEPGCGEWIFDGKGELVKFFTNSACVGFGLKNKVASSHPNLTPSVRILS